MNLENNVLNKLKLLSTNKVIIYLVTRYLTYFIQFISSIFIAINFGPYYLGIWGFISLLINYISYINFGIPNSINILIVQNKLNDQKVKDFIADSLVLTFILSLLIFIFGFLYYFVGIEVFDKYQLSQYFYIICLIGVFFHFDSLFGTVYRIKNSLFELAFFQSVVPVLVFISIFFSKEENLVSLILWMTLFGEVLALILFIVNGKIPRGGKPSLSGVKIVISKGFYLFLYNISFFLIALSTRTIISIYFTIDDFGYFSFAYNLSSAILLFLQALSVVIFPKIIDKLHSKSMKDVVNVLNILNINYVTLSYGLIFIAMALFPIFFSFIPKYYNTLKVVNLIAISLLFYANSFGYGSYLMAQNQDKRLAIISFISLIFNVIVSLILVYFYEVKYEYLILATLGSYFIFGFSCVYYTKVLLGLNKNFINVLIDLVPLRLLIPFLISIIIVVFDLNYFIIIPLVIFILLNSKEIKQILNTINIILFRPTIIDIN
jgi:O-antigen/teichoic acid export membrane protein